MCHQFLHAFWGKFPFKHAWSSTNWEICRVGCGLRSDPGFLSSSSGHPAESTRTLLLLASTMKCPTTSTLQKARVVENARRLKLTWWLWKRNNDNRSLSEQRNHVWWNIRINCYLRERTFHPAVQHASVFCTLGTLRHKPSTQATNQRILHLSMGYIDMKRY